MEAQQQQHTGCGQIFLVTEKKLQHSPLLFISLLPQIVVTQNNKMVSIQSNFSASPLNNPNKGALLNHTLKYAFSDLGAPGFVFSRDCSAFT